MKTNSLTHLRSVTPDDRVVCSDNSYVEGGLTIGAFYTVSQVHGEFLELKETGNSLWSISRFNPIALTQNPSK